MGSNKDADQKFDQYAREWVGMEGLTLNLMHFTKSQNASFPTPASIWQCKAAWN
jgi:hypothetical protein